MEKATERNLITAISQSHAGGEWPSSSLSGKTQKIFEYSGYIKFNIESIYVNGSGSTVLIAIQHHQGPRSCACWVS